MEVRVEEVEESADEVKEGAEGGGERLLMEVGVWRGGRVC